MRRNHFQIKRAVAILRTSRLKAQAEALPRGPATLSETELRSHLLPEAEARYLERLEKDWAERVLRR